MHALYEALDGQVVTVGEIEGTLTYETYMAIYPYEHRVHRLIHTATEAGRASDAYRAITERLGDAFVSDLTQSTHLPCIAIKLLGQERVSELLGIRTLHEVTA